MNPVSLAKHYWATFYPATMTRRQTIEDANALWSWFQDYFDDAQRTRAWAIGYEARAHLLECVRAMIVCGEA